VVETASSQPKRGRAVRFFHLSTFGRLGHGSDEDEFSPKMINALRHLRIAAAAASGYHSLALAEGVTVFSWGQNTASELGLGQVDAVATLPQKVETLRGLMCVPWLLRISPAAP
jgi:alpha-tubulin suppressor-like RCC1 family protein